MPVTLTKTGPVSGEITFSTTLGPETTFDYLADFGKHQEWTDELVTMEQTSAGPIAVGTTYRSVERLRPGEEMKEPTFAEVTAFERPRLIEWKTWTSKGTVLSPAARGGRSRSCRTAGAATSRSASRSTRRTSGANSHAAPSSPWRTASWVAPATSPKQITKRAEQLQHVLDVRNAVEHL